MRSRVLPFLLGFILLGALGHTASRHGSASASIVAPKSAPLPQASLPRQLRTSADNAETGLPTFVPEADSGGCARGPCTWSI